MEPKTQKTIAEIEAARRRRDGTLFVWVCLAILLFVGAVLAFWCSLQSDVEAAWETMRIDTPAEGVGRAETFADAPLKGAAEVSESAGTLLRVFCDTDDPLPEWWDPDGAEIVYQAEPVKDIASPDWNLNTTLWGWEGHGAEVWEIDLFAKCFYLEFWGASYPCCEAGCDAMLNLWASGLYGRTLGESLSAVNDFGAYVYSVYPNVWTANYDPDGLAWCREFCESRFYEGPKWECMYFQLYGFHDTSWAIPLYEIDGVYFSMGR